MRKRPHEELAKIVNDHIKKYDSKTRNDITIGTGINTQKLNELEQLGLIKLPPKVKAGMHSKTWRWYKT
jgi:hypothetical protein